MTCIIINRILNISAVSHGASGVSHDAGHVTHAGEGLVGAPNQFSDEPKYSEYQTRFV